MPGKPIRVLQIVSGLEHGGIEKIVSTYYKNINRENVQFDFITHRAVGMIEREIADLGCRIYHISFRRKHPFKSAIETYKIVKRHKYAIIHIHGNIEIIPELFACKLAGAKTRIAHSHIFMQDSSVFQNMLNLLSRFWIRILATDYFACSVGAGIWGYGKRYEELDRHYTLHNAIDLKKYQFSSEKRVVLRKELRVENKFVIGNIGRLSIQKNQKFLFKVFSLVEKEIPGSVLIIIGVGELEQELKQAAKNYGIEEKVIFLGLTDKVEDYMCAMDVFVLPSRWEGLPIVGIEAQANGLRTIVSTNVTSEVMLTENIIALWLNDGYENWKQRVIESINYGHQDCTQALIDNGYEIYEEARKLERYYITAYNQRMN